METKVEMCDDVVRGAGRIMRCQPLTTSNRARGGFRPTVSRKQYLRLRADRLTNLVPRTARQHLSLKMVRPAIQSTQLVWLGLARGLSVIP